MKCNLASLALAIVVNPLTGQPLDEIQLWTLIECHANAYTGNWVNTGPFETSTYGPNLGQIHAIAVHPTDTSIIYVGAPNGGMWKTIDGGKHWTPLMNFETLPPTGVRWIVINPHNPDVVLAATAAAQGRWAHGAIRGYGMGVLLSFDGGQTWESTQLRFDPTSPQDWYSQITTYKLVLLPRTSADTTWILAMTKNQVHLMSLVPSNRSAEQIEKIQGGDHWAQETHRDIEIHPKHPDTIWLATNTGLLRTFDGGTTWDTLRNYHLPGERYPYYRPCWNESNIRSMFIEYRLNHLFLFEQRADDSCGNSVVSIQFSRDLGDTWEGYNTAERVNTFNIFAISETDSMIHVRSGLHNYVVNLNLDLTPATPAMSTANTHVDPRGFLIIERDGKEILYQGNDGGINISTDHRTWRDITGTGLGMGQYYAIGSDPNNVHRYIAGAQDGSINFYNNGEWQMTSGGDNGDAIFHPADSSIVYFSSNNALTRSTNGGKSFQVIKVGDGGMASVMFPMKTHPRNPDTLMVGFKRLWRCDNGRRASSRDFYEVAAPHGDEHGILSIEISKADPDLVYFSYSYYQYDGADLTKGLLFRTTDGATTRSKWKDITGTLGRNVSGRDAPLRGGPISDIVTDPVHPARVWVCFGGFGEGKKVFYSPDTGNTWYNMSDGLPNLPSNAIVYQKGSNDRLYLGMDGGVYYWEPDSARWYKYCGGFPNAIILDMDVHECGSLLRVATFGRGIWEVNLIPPDPLSVRGLHVWQANTNGLKDIRVRKRATLIVKGTLNMSQGRKIMLDKRATLIVDGGRIANTCSATWEGIKVPTTKRGKKRARVIVKNDGVIEGWRMED